MVNALDEDAEAEVWQSALEALLASGATRAEALEGANMILHAFRRRRAQEAAAAEASLPLGPRGGTKR